MLHDSRKHIRELTVRRVLGTREKKTKNSGGLHLFKLPKLNFEAAYYIDLIYWLNCAVTEPPLTMHIKDKDLKEMCKEEQFPVLTFEEFLCHTQSVERCVKLISEAGMKVCGETARDGYIRAKLQLQNEVPSGTIHRNPTESPQGFIGSKGREINSSLFGFQKSAMRRLYPIVGEKRKVVTVPPQ
ncbi:hypothetical protein AVEN_34972-1 [Araneus ventricosus]|uniref:Uncharacterized protein n=1 Tax=Araneus ventricosus TaxID=182803 RepID=A0A4Y2DER4_ARAVE|nr:hypothetical protein AVEN_34972-1 [Araneus ventricosus]